MLSIVEILSKLNALPVEFAQACREKKWCRAASTYETALLVSKFIELDEEARDKLMGKFNHADVVQAYKAAGWYKEGDADAKRGGDRKEAV